MDFTPTQVVEISEFSSRAMKGLRYGEDFFCACYAFTEEKNTPEVILEFFSGLLLREADRTPYGKFLIRHKSLDELRAKVTMPGFAEDLTEISREQLYKNLLFHVPSSDLLGLLGIDPQSRIFVYRIITSMGTFSSASESGNVLYVAHLPGKKIAIIHTFFR